MNPGEAKTMMIATLRWRDEFKVEEVINEKFDSDIFGNMGYIYGKDKEGRPVTYVLRCICDESENVFTDLCSWSRSGITCMGATRT